MRLSGALAALPLSLPDGAQTRANGRAAKQRAELANRRAHFGGLDEIFENYGEFLFGSNEIQGVVVGGGGEGAGVGEESGTSVAEI